jgi:hypothetical protein
MQENAKGTGKLNILLAHFNFEMQHILDDFQKGDLSWHSLKQEYLTNDSEDHDISVYKSLFMHAQANPSRIKLVASIMPRPYAYFIMDKKGVPNALEVAKQRGYVDPSETAEGSKEHYNLFES